MEDLNYYVYFVGVSHPDGLFKSGDRGVGYTSFGPGIRDCRYGVMYVVPKEYVFHRRPTAEYVERCVIKYFGLVLEKKKVVPEEEIQWVKTI